MFSIFGLAGYWWLVFVPSERRDLAVNKNKGGLNAYLDRLDEAPEGVFVFLCACMFHAYEVCLFWELHACCVCVCMCLCVFACVRSV
jgi:hypothetical protein